MTGDIHFEPELGERLQGIYGLVRKPRNADEFFRLPRAESERHVETRKFLDLVWSKKAVIGETHSETRDWILVDGAKRVNTLCSYDTLMTGVLQRDAEIGSSCPHCGQDMTIRIRDGKLEHFLPKELRFLWGTGPVGLSGNPMCDHLHLFLDKRHTVAWIESKEGEMGFSFGLREAIRRLGQRF